MLRLRGALPFDKRLYCQTVTVYHREGLTRRVLEGVHFEYTQSLAMDLGRAQTAREFLLVIPGEDTIAPGDLVVEGVGPEVIARDPEAATVLQVKPCSLMGRISHTEVRGR